MPHRMNANPSNSLLSNSMGLGRAIGCNETYANPINRRGAAELTSCFAPTQWGEASRSSRKIPLRTATPASPALTHRLRFWSQLLGSAVNSFNIALTSSMSGQRKHEHKNGDGNCRQHDIKQNYISLG